MAWCPFAEKLELQPESDAQPAIRPTQLIFHSIVAPWTPRRTYEFWRDSTSLESHFGVGYDGDTAQYIGTETRADANYKANRRPDGTGAISVETASNTKASDLWTPAQVEALIRLGVWAHQRHGVPLRICRSHDDPGFGYHKLHSAWSPSGTACPGVARTKQFHEVVFPGIATRATGTKEEDDVAISDADAEKIARAVLRLDGEVDAPWGSPTNQTWMLKSVLTHATKGVLRVEKAVQELAARGAARDAVLARLAEGGGLDAAEIERAAQEGATAALNRLATALAEDEEN